MPNYNQLRKNFDHYILSSNTINNLSFPFFNFVFIFQNSSGNTGRGNERQNMDCSICNSMPFLLRPPRNTICGACYEGAKSIITLMNKLEGDKGSDNIDTKANNSLVSPANSCKYRHQLGDLPKWLSGLNDQRVEMNKKIAFLSGFGAAFRERIHTDIQLVPGDNGLPLATHRALLAARSEIFKNMLESEDGCKAPPSETIKLAELKHEELESLLDFLYTGSLPREKMEKHVYSLFLAADKYAIQYLQEFCERHMLLYLNSSTALDVLEISDVCSNKTLKDAALNFIVKNMEEIAFSSKFEVFAPKNQHLYVQITRAFFMDIKSKRVTGV